jgi:hypothetical protein
MQTRLQETESAMNREMFLSMLSYLLFGDQEAEEGPIGDQAEKFAGLIACNFSS